MKTGSCGMSGDITNALMQFLYCLVPAMSRPVQVVRQYVRNLYRVIRFNPATVCSALALVCFSAVGALAQDGGDRRRPDVKFNAPLPTTHDGETPFTVNLRFSEEIFADNPRNPFRATDIAFDIMGFESLPGGDDRLNYTPVVSDLVLVEMNNADKRNWTFTVTPISNYKGVRNNIRLDFVIRIPQGVVTDFSGNENWGTGIPAAPHLSITYVAPPPPNMAPVANAGPDQPDVVSGTTVTLDGSGSTDDNGIPEDTGYTWTRTGGTSTLTPTLTRATTAMPTFTADTLASDDTAVTHIFSLVVTDDDDADSTNTATVTITINPPPPNMAPVANAGPDQPDVVSGTTVTLDGSGSTDDNEIPADTGYTWTRTGGTSTVTPTLTRATTAMPTFTADTLASDDTAVTHIFSLVVTDDDDADSTNTATVTITINPPPPADTKGPEGNFETGWPKTHDGSTPFTMAIDFTEPVVFEAKDISFAEARTCTSCLPDGSVDFARDYSPTASNVMVDPNDNTRWTFTVTPKTHTDGISVDFTVSVLRNTFEDLAGNENEFGISHDKASMSIIIRYVAPPPNMPPTANAGPDQTVNSGAMVTLDGSSSTDSDDDDTKLMYAWTRDGTAGGTAAAVTLTGANTATPTFMAAAVDAGEVNDKTYIFTLTVTDEDDGTDDDTVMITINSSPIARIESGKTTPSGESVTLVSTSLDGDDVAELKYSWARTGGTGDAAKVTWTGEDRSMLNVTPTDDVATMADAKTHEFTLMVTDEYEATHTSDPVTVTVEEPIADPVVIVAGGTTQTKSQGTSVVLDGTGSTKDRRRSIATYSWARTGGTGSSGITLTGGNTAQLSFTADDVAPGADDVTHIFTLTVTDDGGNIGTETVTVTVQAGPKADAGGNRNIFSGAMVQLDGSGSRVGAGRTLKYTWTQLTSHADCTGSQISRVNLTGETTAMPTFTADNLGSLSEVKHLFQLTVSALNSDGSETGETATAIACLTVVPANASPVAEAGSPQTVNPGELVELTGATATDADGNDTIASHVWTRTGGTMNQSVSITNATSLTMAEFVAEPRTLAPGAADVEHIITLTVTDNRGEIGTDTVTITVMAPFAAPVANAGANQMVGSGAMVELDGMGSTFDRRRPISYAWTRTGGTGGSVTLSNADMQKSSFTADTLMERDADVTHIFTLTVTDSSGEIDTDEVMVTVNAPNLAPMVTITAPDGSPVKLEVASGEAVTLVGSGRDDDGTISSYAWVRTGGTGQTNLPLTGTDTEQLGFVADSLEPGELDVTHIFTLTVTDNDGGTHTATVTVTVTPNARPEAHAGPDQTVISGATVTLDGSESTDSGGSVTGYTWTRTGGSGDDKLVLTGATTIRPTFTADILAPGASDVTHIFSLVVTDNNGAVSLVADTVTVTIKAATVRIAVSSSELVVQEGGSGVYQVRLSESPGGAVTIMATSDNPDVVRLKTAQLQFNDTNWKEWQDVEIITVAESVKKGDEAKVVIRHSLEGVAMGDQPGEVTVTVRAQEDDLIMAPVGQFIATRATALINNQPGLSSFLKLDGPAPGGNFTFQATDGRLSMDGGFIHNGVWGKVTGSWTNSDSGDTESVLGSFGIHRKYSDRFLAGVMLQFDLADHDLNRQAGTIDGTGWLAGPYFAVRHDTRPLYFEGRLLYGQSDNDIRFIDRNLGVRTGSFDTKRLLAQVRMEGEIALSDRDEGPRLIPYADAHWIEDRAAAFTTVSATGFSVPVLGQKVSVSQLELGSNVEVPIAVSDGAMTFTGGLGVIYSNTEGDFISSVSRSRGRGRGEIGFSYGLDDNIQIDFNSFYDGIGHSGYEGYGLSVSAEMKF